jgi:hypothetical protein
MKNLIRLIVAYALVIMLWASFALLVNNGRGAPMVVLGITTILLASATYLLKITK